MVFCGMQNQSARKSTMLDFQIVNETIISRMGPVINHLWTAEGASRKPNRFRCEHPFQHILWWFETDCFSKPEKHINVRTGTFMMMQPNQHTSNERWRKNTGK
jgi:hypothetical protein